MRDPEVLHEMTKARKDGVNAPDSGAEEEGEALPPLSSFPRPGATWARHLLESVPRPE